MAAASSISVIIPVFRGDAYLDGLLGALSEQSVVCDEVWVVETEPTARARATADEHGARYRAVARASFDHAGTRTEAARAASGEVLVFLTQDVLPAGETTLETLVNELVSDDGAGGAYGRQVPDDSAGPAAVVKRVFNYPDQSLTKTLEQRTVLGLRTPFLSNAFAAYRRTALESIGYFGERRLICEDLRAGASLLEAGWSIRYVADAVVRHTHDFGLTEELRRYFDIGVAHRRDSWILDRFGGSDRDGLRYLRMGIAHLRCHGRWSRIPGFVVRSALGRAAYSLGRHHRLLPRGVNRRLSSMPLWWDRSEG